MKKLVIRGGKPLTGEITINGAKNSTVALIPAAILADSEVVLEGVPDIADVYSLIDILEDFNVKASFKDNVLTIDPSDIKSIPMPSGKIQSLRASYYFMGATLSRFGEGVIGLPGGCFLGPRPIDQHLKAFRSLGAKVEDDFGVVTLTTDQEGLVGARIYMDVVSVGATINCILAAVKAKGKTIIENAAREPESICMAVPTPSFRTGLKQGPILRLPWQQAKGSASTTLFSNTSKVSLLRLKKWARNWRLVKIPSTFIQVQTSVWSASRLSLIQVLPLTCNNR